MRRTTLAVLALLACWWGGRSAAVEPREVIITGEQAEGTVALRNVSIRGGRILGEVVNQGERPVESVRLLIRHIWVWKNERNPGSDNPGRALFHVVRETIPPGEAVRFRYEPDPPLPERDDGHFETTVEVVGFTELSPPR